MQNVDSNEVNINIVIIVINDFRTFVRTDMINEIEQKFRPVLFAMVRLFQSTDIFSKLYKAEK
jgi:hypothetical protein